ncbi:hypothetical protein Q31b_23490 [Novipirellula aureliae]|uniref:Uncharacterized protein n=1 Tax=Novipirellula aureliae TaxID=2527966 RepID=A0A5C6E6P0_9BACT|nr:hypothetical protein [Novipirellula aureliae]TWU43311.1 hypothetical protein Q31b_23490 [Novipirellula aureliae]
MNDPALQYDPADFVAVESAFLNSGQLVLHIEPDEDNLVKASWTPALWGDFDQLEGVLSSDN